MVYRYVEGTRLPDVLAGAVATVPPKLAARALGIGEADAYLFHTLDEAFRLFGHRTFTSPQLISELGQGRSPVNHYLSRGLARGSLEMTEDGAFRVLPEAVSPSGLVGRQRLKMTSRFATEVLVNSVARLFEALSSAELTVPFSARAYRTRKGFPTNASTASFDLTLGLDLGLIEAEEGAHGGETLLRSVEGAQLPDAIAERLPSASTRIVDVASGASRADVGVFKALDEALRLFGYREFSVGQLARATRLPQSVVRYYLDRGLARGSLTMTEDAMFSVLPEAVSPPGWVGRTKRPISSRFFTEQMLNAVARLLEARRSEGSTDWFTQKDYLGRSSSNNKASAARQLNLGRDLGLVEERQSSDGRQSLYRYVEGARLPDALAEKVRYVSTKIAALASGVGKADANLFAAMDSAFEIFGHGLFTPTLFQRRLGLSPLAAYHYLNRALARGSLDMDEFGSFSIPPEALSPSGRVSQRVRRFSSRFATASLIEALRRLLEVRSSEGFPDTFTRKTYTERTPASRPKAIEELELGEDLGLVEKIGPDPANRRQGLYRFKPNPRLPLVIARTLRATRRR